MMISRLYKNTDFDSLVDLLKRVRPPKWSGDYPALIDLHEILAQPAPRARTRLWFEQGDKPSYHEQLVAYALVDAYNNMLFEIEPGYALESEVIGWGEACLRKMRAQGTIDNQATLDGSCRQEDTRRMDILLKHGFEVLPGSSLHFRCTVPKKISLPKLSPGFILTNAAALGESPGFIERVVALHRAAFTSEHMTVEERQSIVEAPEYEALLDLFVVSPDGRLAGYCNCTIDANTPGIGYTDPIAVHPEFQRQGIGRVLLLAGLNELGCRAVEEARFSTSSENQAMQGLGKATGFTIYERIAWLAKVV